MLFHVLFILMVFYFVFDLQKQIIIISFGHIKMFKYTIYKALSWYRKEDDTKYKHNKF